MVVHSRSSAQRAILHGMLIDAWRDAPPANPHAPFPAAVAADRRAGRPPASGALDDVVDGLDPQAQVVR